jgi:hypothetical protein
MFRQLVLGIYFEKMGMALDLPVLALRLPHKRKRKPELKIQR